MTPAPSTMPSPGDAPSIEDALLYWSFSNEGVFKVPNGSSDLSDAAASAFKQLLSEGLRVLLHKRLESAGGRITRVRRVMVLSDDVLRFCTTEGDTLVDEGEGIPLSAIDYVCVGPCTSSARRSLHLLHGKLYSLDAMEQSKRMFSLLGQGRSIDVEVRPTERQSRPKHINDREEASAAQDIACCSARTLQRLAKMARCTPPPEGALEIVPMSAYAELIRVDVRNGEELGFVPLKSQFRRLSSGSRTSPSH